MSAKWRKFSLGELTNWSSGGTPSKKNTEFWTGSIPWISASSMRSTRYSESELKITSEGLKSGSRLAPMGSILLLVRGSILHQKIPVGIATRDVAFNQDVKAIQVKKHLVDDEVVDNWYLFYWLKANEKLLLSIVENTGIGAGKLDTKQLQELEIDVPSWDEQQQIVACCKAIEEKEIINAQINQTLEQMAQAIFKSWFVDFEPVKAKIAALEAGCSEDDALLAAMQAIAGSALFTTDAVDTDAPTQLARLQSEHPEQYTTLRATAELFPSAMQESELGEIPEGWEETGFSDWVAIKRGRSITRAKVVPGDVPVVAGGLEPAYYHNEYNVIGPVITISASGANAGYVNLYHQNIWSSDSSHISKKSTPYFYTAYVCLKYYQKAIFDMQTGAAQPYIYPKDFERLKVVVGSDKLLEQVESLLVSFFEQSAVLKSESESLAQLRDTLLPKLLSGELSLAATEEQLADTVEPAHV